ncbi:hypothetical protein ACFL6G_09840, partial [candidate division KSB1 bacterium]
MKRREFLGKAALTSAVVLTSETAAESKTKQDEPNQEPTAACKITVIKRAEFPELEKKYSKEVDSPCPRFKEGEEFIITSPYKPPE